MTESSTTADEAVSASPLSCPVCGHTFAPYRVAQVFRCPSCGTWRSTLDVRINEVTDRLLDEEERSEALRELRQDNFREILGLVGKRLTLQGARLLDVGSAHGWFLAAAHSAGASAEGIEPDDEMAKVATGDGATVRVGYFPDVLSDGETFDVIAFNDVLEHLPDVGAALDACRATLRPKGVLSVNIPNAGGLGYRLARVLARLGMRGPFERLWQVGLPSPHLWFFDEAGLTRLAGQHGLKLVTSARLKSVTRSGLWSRVHFDRRPGPVSVVSFAGLWLLAPVFNTRRNSDIMLLLFARDEA